MGRSVNKVTLIGTLGRDPEVRYMPNGNAVANLSLATDESYNDKQTGQKVEQTEWHRITIYGKLAEIVQQYLKKGSRAYFEGKLRTREWEKDGVKRYTTEIIANDMMMLDSRGDSAGGFSNPSMNAPMGGMNNAGMNNQGMAQPMNNPAGYAAQPAPQPAQQPMTQAPQHGYQQAAPMQQQQPPQQQPQPQHQQAAPQQQPGGYQQAPQQQATQQAPQPSNSFDDFDDDIPF